MSLPFPSYAPYNDTITTNLHGEPPMPDTIQPIRMDRLRGMTYKAIAEKYGIDQRTAKRYADGNLPLDELDHRPFSSMLDPYDAEIRRLLRDGPVFSKEIYRHLRTLGYEGGYTIVNRKVQQIIQEHESAGLYPKDRKRHRISSELLPLTERINEEKRHAADHNRPGHK